ncbi:MAG TPA: hypothetical protein EYP22_05630 [Methanosarcinales archaeon]|nr:hypothetical protein [Methanosarcinales archaeon]
MPNAIDLLKYRGELEDKLRGLLGRAIYVIELDIFALPCGCYGITANTRGLELDDLEVFEEHLLPYFKDLSQKLEVNPKFIFARLVPGSSLVVAINWRVLCNRCYLDFAGAKGKIPRPDLYIMHFEKI